LNSQHKNSIDALNDYEDALTHRSAGLTSGRKKPTSRFEKEQAEARMARASDYLERYTTKHGDD